MQILQLGRFKVPIKFKYPSLEGENLIQDIMAFPPFIQYDINRNMTRWQSNFSRDVSKDVMVNDLTIQDVDYFGKRIGFLKFVVRFGPSLKLSRLTCSGMMVQSYQELFFAEDLQLLVLSWSKALHLPNHT